MENKSCGDAAGAVVGNRAWGALECGMGDKRTADGGEVLCEPCVVGLEAFEHGGQGFDCGPAAANVGEHVLEVFGLICGEFGGCGVHFIIGLLDCWSGGVKRERNGKLQIG